MGTQGHYNRWFIDIYGQFIVEDKQTTISAGSVNLLHILHRQSTEQYYMESSRIDLKNSIIVGSVIENTKTDGSRHVLVQCMRVVTVQVRVKVQVLSSQVRVHCFQVQVHVLEICTRVLSEYKYQVLQLC